ncbi:hypothetical protein [Mycobacterium sp. 050134]|uniref:hypothetical protein n=1 Tax=Mycobacterium sp. 050134 TaxID=3096111 RepID=UPI002ED8280F
MRSTRTLMTVIAGALLSGGLAAGGLGLAAGTAQAHPGIAPIPADNPDWGPAHRWCPGEPLPATGNHVTDPFRGWDMSVCQTYYYLWPGMGNVSNMIWDGDNPPPKPPPPPALITRDNCQQILGIFCPHA